MDESAFNTVPGPEVTPELFRKWRSPRSGNSNPQRMDNPVWEWLVRSRLNAFQANQAMTGPSPFEAGPCWSFDRFGQTSTTLPDGRVVWIGGEHEDFYDPDFYIYNDVVVQQPDGGLRLFGYPRSIFPPTDFHSATLLANRIIIIGCLGYPAERAAGKTFVAALDLETFAMENISTGGTPPGWIHRHEAVLQEGQDVIVIRGGKLHTEAENMSLVDNIDEWALNLRDWHWRRLTQRQWTRRIISRQDGGLNHYWEIERLVWSQRLKWGNQLHTQRKELEKKLGHLPDLELFHTLFRPSVSHEPLPEQEGELHVFRIRVDGVVVRYEVEMNCVQMRVEGSLPASKVDALVTDITRKWSELENHPFVARVV